MIMKKVCLIALLYLLAFPAAAQEVALPEDSMRDAWSDKQEQFDSLSREPSYGYDRGVDSGYGSSGYQDNRSGDLPSSEADIDLDQDKGVDLTEQPELDER